MMLLYNVSSIFVNISAELSQFFLLHFFSEVTYRVYMQHFSQQKPQLYLNINNVVIRSLFLFCFCFKERFYKFKLTERWFTFRLILSFSQVHLKQHDFEYFHLMHTKQSFSEFTSLTEMSLFFLIFLIITFILMMSCVYKYL